MTTTFYRHRFSPFAGNGNKFAYPIRLGLNDGHLASTVFDIPVAA